jgi:hypothetical protein
MKEAERYCIDMIDKIEREKMFALSHPRTVSIAELLKKVYRYQGREDKIATIRKEIPTVGVTDDRNWFDPYAARRGPQKSSPTHESSNSLATSQVEPQYSEHTQALSSTSADIYHSDPVVKVIARRTF